MSEPIVRLEGVVKGYGVGATRVEVLRGLDLEVRAGEMLAVVGPSGVGKSTLLHLIGLLDRQEEGRLEVDGVDPSRVSLEERARLRNRLVGFVFQHHYLLDELDALDNVALPLRIGGQPARAARERAAELLAAVALSGRVAHYPDQLSGGELQRVAIARALANQPAIVLADEPTGELDAATGREILSLFRRLHADGTTLVVVTHDERLAAEAGRVVRLLDGRVVA